MADQNNLSDRLTQTKLDTTRVSIKRSIQVSAQTSTKPKFRSEWSSSFDISGIHVLIVCRGPIRLEAVQVLQERGAFCGILLSEKDSIVYQYTRAPEWRIIDPKRVYFIQDYSGTNQVERSKCIDTIIQIAKEHKYEYIFAGYGFMAEDAGFVESIEIAGLRFMGPASGVHRTAGTKDTAKMIARKLNISVTPGVDNIAALTLLSKKGSHKKELDQLAEKHQLNASAKESNIEEYAESLLQEGYKKGIGLISLEEIQEEACKRGSEILKKHPNHRLRLKYIGGGGGKGQRIVEREDQIPAAVLEVLSEAKVMGEGDNKNFLMELNIENIRHNEIQLLGNGDWCISMGGRDCSLQMHEQKLVELSLTKELLIHEINLAKKNKEESLAKLLSKDYEILIEMEDQAIRFGKAVHLDSASTFETIVSEDTFYFMEMNTRIQVEHRVSEMVYLLRFVNPNNSGDFFEVDTLVHAMALIAVFGKNLPKPERIEHNISGGEIRLNAQNSALQPSAGGIIDYWSPPLPEELRDDQGISFVNKDTNEFIPYYLAGAYDSNIALIVSSGKSRKATLQSLAEILRCMEITGPDLQTNRDFHYGFLHFCLGLHPLFKPNTNFVPPYLCAVGNLAVELEKIDLEHIWFLLKENAFKNYGDVGIEILNRKQMLILRPLKILQEHPHVCAGWLMYNLNQAFHLSDNQILWKKNPLHVLGDLYSFLRLEARENAIPIHSIWPQDQLLLEDGLRFYRQFGELSSQKNADEDSRNWDNIASNFETLPVDTQNDAYRAHVGWQLGMESLDSLIWAGHQSNLLKINLDDNLQPIFPVLFMEEEEQKKATRVLAPPLVSSGDTIVAQTGGMFYAKETPDSPPYLEQGTNFSIGDPIYIIEVMKMFNKIHAEFSGIVEEILIDSTMEGEIVRKGQPLFRIKVEKTLHKKSPEEKVMERKKNTEEIWALSKR